jgi:hypothetical protein
LSPEVLPRLQRIEEKIEEKLEEYSFKSEKECLKNKNKIDRLKRKIKVHFYAKGFDKKFDEMKKKKIRFTEQIRAKFDQKHK